MNRRTLVCLLLLAVTILSPGFGEEKTVDEVFESVQGAWESTKATQAGVEKQTLKRGWYWNFADAHTLIVAMDRDGNTDRCVLELDPITSPISFRFSPPVESKEGKRMVIAGILKQDGNDLVVALSHPAVSAKPPEAFESTKENRVILLRFSRPRIPIGENAPQEAKTNLRPAIAEKSKGNAD
jgi:uncharacterized protein (TIGR03067 family)